MCEEVAGNWLPFCTECCVSFVRTLARGFPAVTWRVTWWQRAVLRQLWSLQPAKCRWSKTGPSATRQREPRKMSPRSSHRNSTSTSGQVSHFLPLHGLYISDENKDSDIWMRSEAVFWFRGNLHRKKQRCFLCCFSWAFFPFSFKCSEWIKNTYHLHQVKL